MAQAASQSQSRSVGNVHGMWSKGSGRKPASSMLSLPRSTSVSEGVYGSQDMAPEPASTSTVISAEEICRELRWLPRANA